VVNSLSYYFPVLAAIKHFPGSGFRIHNEKVARQTARFSGRTAITADISVSEPKPPEDINSPLKFSMEGYKGQPPADLIPYYWSPGWNSPQAVNKYLDEPNGSLKDGDPGVSILNNKIAAPGGYVKTIPESFKASPDKFFLIPVPRVFGSEELSALGEAVSKLIPAPFLVINEKDAARVKVKANVKVKLSTGGKVFSVIVQTDNAVPDGVAGISSLIPGMHYIGFPESGSLIIS